MSKRRGFFCPNHFFFRFSVKKTLIAAAGAVLGVCGIALADALVHEQASATPTVTFNSHSFVLNGKPVFLFGGQIEPARVPRDQWRDRLLRMKQAGYNAVSTYIFWSAHEQPKGVYHFDDNLDLDAWFTLLKQLGLYSFVRLGPYVCSEWDLGGWPAYLAGENVTVRTYNTALLGYVDKWFAKVVPIIQKYQIHKGGTIIFYQLENEYEQCPTQDNNYKTWLADKAKSLGMEVPYLFSGQNHDWTLNPSQFPTSTWICTEFWTKTANWGAAYWYGDPDASTMARINNGTWKGCASGIAGFFHYMGYGGTNFGYAGDYEGQMTSYDYQCHIAETGRFRPDYYGIKRAGLLAQSFNDLLASSTNGSSLIDPAPTNVTAYVNNSTIGKLAFLENKGTAPIQGLKLKFKSKSAAIPTQGSVTLPAGQFCHFLADYGLTSNDTIDYCTPNILGMKTIGTSTYLICYGSADAAGEIAIRCQTAPATLPASPWQWNAASKTALLSYTYPTTSGVKEYQFSLKDGKTLKLLVMNDAQADNTWITDSMIVSGVHFVEDSTVEFPYATGGQAIVYTAGNRQEFSQQPVAAPSAIPITAPTWSTADARADTSLNDSSWQSSSSPLSMDAYGWHNAYGWYRATINANQAATQTIALPTIMDYRAVFWNGKRSGLTVPVKQGKNVLAIFVGHYARNKAVGYQGNLGTFAPQKGLLGNVTLGGSNIYNWRFKGGLDLDESSLVGTVTNWSQFLGRAWNSGATAADSVPRFYKYTFNYTANSTIHQTFRLTCSSLSRGAAWINGHSLGRTRTNMPTYAPLYVPECWLQATNTLIIFSQDGVAPGGLALTPQETYSVQQISPVSVRPESQRQRSVLPHNVTANVLRTVYDLQGRVVARIPAGKNLTAILQMQSRRGVYIVRTNGQSQILVAPGSGMINR